MIGQAPPRCNQCMTTLGQLDQGEDGYAFSEGDVRERRDR